MAYSAIRCKGCGKNKYPMEMHNKEQCKICWLKAYEANFKGRIYKSWNTRRKNKLLYESG